nr:MAG TPA: hypothetical protein [Caudoviricetes sp.]
MILTAYGLRRLPLNLKIEPSPFALRNYVLSL